MNAVLCQCRPSPASGDRADTIAMAEPGVRGEKLDNAARIPCFVKPGRCGTGLRRQKTRAARAHSAYGAWLCTSVHRLEHQDRALFLVGGQVETPVRTLAHIAYALPQVGEQGFAAQFLHVLVEEQ